MILRPLAAEDMDALTALARACDETYLDWAPRGWFVPAPPRGWADRYVGDGAFALLGWEDEELVASVAFRTVSASLAHVGQLLVRPTHWRRGIARRMLGLAEDEMRTRGFTRERLWTPLGAPAEHFYRALGWARDGRQEWHPWAGLEMVGYAKDLA